MTFFNLVPHRSPLAVPLVRITVILVVHNNDQSIRLKDLLDRAQPDEYGFSNTEVYNEKVLAKGQFCEFRALQEADNYGQLLFLAVLR